MTIALVIVAVIAALIGLLWLIGAREPVYAISAGEAPHWFIAVRGEPGAPAPGVTERWRSSTDFTMIGGAPDEAYWQHFIIAVGGDEAEAPLALDGGLDPDDREAVTRAQVRLWAEAQAFLDATVATRASDLLDRGLRTAMTALQRLGI